MNLIRQPEIVLKCGAIKLLPEIIKFLETKNALIVTDRGLISTGIYSKIEQSLKSSNIKTILYGGVLPDPSISLIYEALRFAESHNINAVIGLGGGSSIDTAKCVAALLTNRKDINSYVGTNLLKEDPLPLIAIPTTAGTGSEVTPIAILSDENEHLKKGIVSDKLIPDYAILDPELTAALPKNVTAYTGMDALTHAIEAFTSVNSNIYTDSIAQNAIRIIIDNIGKAYEEGSDLSARENMMIGSMMAGIAFANAGVGAVHAFAYPLGGMFHIPHGLANSIMLPYILKYNIQGGSEKFKELARAFEVSRNSPELVAKRITELNSLLNIPEKLSNVGVTKDYIHTLAEQVVRIDRLLKNNPREVTLEDALDIYQKAY